MKNWFKKLLAYFRNAVLQNAYGLSPPLVLQTTSTRTWHLGPPPHIGWWNASKSHDDELWRWWDVTGWSMGASSTASPIGVKYSAAMPA